MPRVLLVARRDWRPDLERTVVWREDVQRAFAVDVASGLHIAESFKPQLIVLDATGLPDPAAAVAHVRGQASTRGTPIFVLVDDSSRALERSLQQAGADATFAGIDPRQWDARCAEVLRLLPRRENRVPVRLEGWWRHPERSEAQPLRALDLSPGGALLETSEAWDTGMTIELGLTLPGSGEPLRARGRVVREVASGTRPRTGVRFIAPRKERALLRAFVSWHAARAVPEAVDGGPEAPSAAPDDDQRVALMEALQDAVVTIGEDGVVREVNAAAEATFGVPRAEIVGRGADALVPAWLRGPARALFHRCLSGEETPRPGVVLEGTGRRGDGAEFPLEATVAVTRHGGRPRLTLCIRDLTDRRSMEERLRQSQKMEAVGRLAGGIAHDFNNLLSVIIGYGEMLRASLPGGPDARHAGEILSAAHRAAALTSQLLAFSRKQVLQPRVLDLNAVVRDMEGMLRPLIGEPVCLVTRLDPELGRISADPTQIEQVILNLSVNARDAMPDGGRLLLETGNVELDDAFVREHPGSRPGAYVVLRVTDDGVGMDSHTLHHVFEPFFTTKERGRGTGLGLATVYGVVKQSDGYIWVNSRPGHGTTFEIALPRVGAAVEVVAEVPALATSRPVGETVLLVEDEAALRRMTRETLEGEGYRVLEADGPVEALAIGSTHPGPIEVMLTDVVMPGMNGRELASRLAAQRPGMRVVYTSGYPDDALGRQGVLDRDTPFLPKPFTREGLARRLREALDEA